MKIDDPLIDPLDPDQVQRAAHDMTAELDRVATIHKLKLVAATLFLLLGASTAFYFGHWPLALFAMILIVAAFLHLQKKSRRRQMGVALPFVLQALDLELTAEGLEFNRSIPARLFPRTAEPLVSKPLNVDWDHKGRLWVVESVEYPEGKRGGGPESMHTLWQRETNLGTPAAVDRPGRDTVSWLEDKDGDGVMDARHVFADDLDLATSFCFYQDGVIVAQPPHILFLRDTDGDGKADKRETLYTGLGTFDTHAVLNNLRWGLDGWVYATQGYSSSPKVTSGDGKTDFGGLGSGIVRFKPDGSKIEMVSAKSGNCWGIDITADGEMFFTQPTSGDLVMHVPVSDRLMAEGGMAAAMGQQHVELV